MVDAARGALGFLTRAPVGTDRQAWEAFRRTPAAFVPVGYLVGALAAVPVVLPLPAATVAVLFPLALVALTGINHADGIADVGDAAVVHGGEDPIAARRRVLKDSSLGVGGTLALALLVAGLVAAGAALAGLPPLAALAVVVAAEVSAKLGMALLACLGTAPADGLGAQLTRVSSERAPLVPVLLALPAAFLGIPSPAAAAALVTGVLTTLVFWRWADTHLGGVNGDVFGAANELARVVALHAGVIAWTLS
ncbi:adenosylcobinamide-GDP ribazoletransferase [Halorientalis sp. IM1011]|uniref:adenosylcobinamide-GDP ribazoletransferase n=1 Tax=Halorientalis sp. IM1011 TaxID=1932360 RepID=UPI00097CD297|nr:adenosylcobinamide-GDP ribazoletransferase [Halorientalis sp. IM1011]